MRRAPQPTSSDIGRWKRLVREVGKAIDNPAGPMGDLQQAERLAKSAVVLGPITRENACIQLVRAARQFCAETARGRRELSERLLELSVMVGEQIAAVTSPPPPSRPPRADIFG